jgi:phage gp36-like protein
VAYITYSDMDNSVDSLDSLVPADKVAATWVGVKIAEAEREINGRLAARYTIPFATAPDLIVAIDMDLATYLCLRGNYTQEDGNVSGWVQEYYNRANGLLTKLENGTILLLDPGAVTDTSSIQSSTTGIAREFTVGTKDSEGNTLTVGTLDGF